MTVRRSKEAAMVVVLVICSFVLTGFARPRSEQGLIFTGFHSAINFFPSVDSRRKQSGMIPYQDDSIEMLQRSIDLKNQSLEAWYNTVTYGKYFVQKSLQFSSGL